VSEQYNFSLKQLFWFITLFAIWCGAWSYMAHAILNYGPQRHIWFFPFLGCFITACVVPLVPLLPPVNKNFTSIGLIVGTLLSVCLNVVLFCIVCSSAHPK
jgi:hypothetical protein